MRIYNTKSRSTESFDPLGDKGVGLYTCGPTVYNYAHIGNLRTYVFEDILKRVLLQNGYEVDHVMNITDVGHLTSDADTGDDKMEKGAQREGKTVWEIAEYYANAFNSDFDALNCLPPNTWCKATEHIQEQIDLVKRLEGNGYTYNIDDGVYFDTTKFERYAEFARLDLDKLRAGARVATVEGKKNASDFALWKLSPADSKRQMEWDSPWGKGFPGWHIECSAMAMKYLGETFDIHCGGIDHVAVHHTNEIAQAEAATGKPFVRYWIHGEFLVMDKEKMAKSGDNFLTLTVLKEKGFDPLDYRYFCFSAHYRSPLTFSWEGLEGSRNALRGLRERIAEWKSVSDGQRLAAPPDAVEKFNAQLREDLNVPNALAVVWTTLRSADILPGAKLSFVEEIDKVLGLDLLREKETEVDTEIDGLLQERVEARKGKDFRRADEIRDSLLERGIILEDTPNGTRWKRA